jgi:hypothetical protein
MKRTTIIGRQRMIYINIWLNPDYIEKLKAKIGLYLL